MSASLVGSEMCIRDRRVMSGNERHPGIVLPRTAYSRLKLQNAGVCAVSYTHLTLPTICSV
eukprot:11511775-Alexandrium_andersonii.AAC.1